MARILRIIDTYDVMVNGRPYKSKVSNKEAINNLECGSGSKYDPKLIKEFINFLKNNN